MRDVESGFLQNELPFIYPCSCYKPRERPWIFNQYIGLLCCLVQTVRRAVTRSLLHPAGSAVSAMIRVFPEESRGSRKGFIGRRGNTSCHSPVDTHQIQGENWMQQGCLRIVRDYSDETSMSELWFLSCMNICDTFECAVCLLKTAECRDISGEC